MTGTGTQADPFIVDNWADFSTIDTSSSEIYVRWADSENKVIDFNEINPEGFSTTVKFPANVDFNGWTLRNFYSTATRIFEGWSSSVLSNISNLILENFYFTGNQTLFYINFNNCIFSGIINSTSNANFGSYSKFSCCSANLKMHSGSQSNAFSYGECRNSDIVLDVTGNRFNITSNSSVYNSRFSGKIEVNSDNVTVSIGYSSVFNLESNRPLNCTAATGISVFNSDTAQKTAGSTANLTGVTSEQLKNAEYLYSIGFPVGVV